MGLWPTDRLRVGKCRSKMFRRKKRTVREDFFPVPATLPPLEGLDYETPEQGIRTWLWTLLAALAVVLLAAYVIVLGVLGVYDGLKDRARANRRLAQEHLQLGQDYLEAGAYELAIGEFDLALRYDAGLEEARAGLQEAKVMVEAQAQPTSETRRSAVNLLYRQAVAHYESGNLAPAIALLDELRGLDPDYQRENVVLMLTTAHYRLGLIAVAEDRMDEAAEHFEAVLALAPDDEKAQKQLDLIRLYTAAMRYWDRDWTATIQAFKGLYALAPDYKDVAVRLRDAYIYRAQSYAGKGQWCRAAEDYAQAVEIMPLEETVDRRDDAQIRCQTAAQELTPVPTEQASARRPTATARPPTVARLTPTPAKTKDAAAAVATATPKTTKHPAAEGRIAFTGFDAARQRYDIYVVLLGGDDARLLRENASHPAFAPRGRRLAFRNLDPLHLGLSILDLRTGESHELTAYVEDSTPAWSPTAEQIVFASNKHGDRRWRLYAIAPTEVRGEGEVWGFGEMPAWSPDDKDGGRIAYHGCDPQGNNCGLWLIKAGGFEPTQLTADPSDTAPAWSPDGKRIAFISARNGNWDLYLVTVADGQVTRLTDHPAAEVAPVWSPDGRWLAFLSDREGAWAVFILNVKTGEVYKVIAAGDAYPDPVHERLSWVP